MRSPQGSGVVALLSLTLSACGARSGLPEGEAGPGKPPGRTISASWQHTCAITQGGQVACWGQPLSSGPVPSPMVVAGLDQVVEVATGQSFDCARRADGTAWCWGGIVGPTPQEVVGGTFSSIVTGSATVCGIQAGGVRCAGAGFLAGSDCNPGQTWSAAAVPVPLLTRAAGLAMGQRHGCAFDATGATSCWGCGAGGLQEDTWSLGSLSPSTAAPVPVPGAGSTTRIAGETESTCAVQGDGSTLCWGDGSQFGAGLLIHPVGPTAAGFPASPLDLDVGVTFSCAAYPDEIRCLGGLPTFADGCTDRTDQPLSVPLPGVQEISVGYLHACARDDQGGVWCWGCNTSGEVGDGTTTARSGPVRVL